MTLAGWLQIALFAAIVGLLTRPLGGYLAQVYTGQRTLIAAAASLPLKPRSIVLRASSRRPNRAGTGTQSPFWSFTPPGLSRSMGFLRLQSILPLNPQAMTAVAPGSGFEHGGQLRHQHQLAVLRR